VAARFLPSPLLDGASFFPFSLLAAVYPTRSAGVGGVEAASRLRARGRFAHLSFFLFSSLFWLSSPFFLFLFSPGNPGIFKSRSSERGAPRSGPLFSPLSCNEFIKRGSRRRGAIGFFPLFFPWFGNFSLFSPFFFPLLADSAVGGLAAALLEINHARYF